MTCLVTLPRGTCSLKGALLFLSGFQLVLRQKHFIFPECLSEKICQTANLHYLSICLSFILLLWEIRAPAGICGIGEALILHHRNSGSKCIRHWSSEQTHLSLNEVTHGLSRR